MLESYKCVCTYIEYCKTFEPGAGNDFLGFYDLESLYRVSQEERT
jgi:hypothetical protein